MKTSTLITLFECVEAVDPSEVALDGVTAAGDGGGTIPDEKAGGRVGRKVGGKTGGKDGGTVVGWRKPPGFGAAGVGQYGDGGH